jgi:uracil phosphoribosyltransferase
MDGITIVEHPLVQHKLTLMRDKDTPTATFRPAAARDLHPALL